jgi:hypothetical protein
MTPPVATVYTNDITRALRVSAELEAGTVSINTFHWLLTRSVSLIILRSTLKCGQIYADLGDLVDTALGLLRQNGLSPTVGVQLAHKELIAKLRRLDFWVISSQDCSYHNRVNADCRSSRVL